MNIEMENYYLMHCLYLILSTGGLRNSQECEQRQHIKKRKWLQDKCTNFLDKHSINLKKKINCSSFDPDSNA